MTEPARKDLDSAAWADPQSLVRAGTHGDTQRVHDLVGAGQHHMPVALLQAQARLHLGTALSRRVA